MTLKDRTEQESHSLISSSRCSALVSLLPTLLRRPLGEKLTVLKSSAFSRITDLSTPYCLPISDSTDLVSLLFTNLHQEQAVIGQEKPKEDYKEVFGSSEVRVKGGMFFIISDCGSRCVTTLS